ncbi:MAG: bifunctional ADP-heptose synthase [Bacteroidota bacterium]|nr:bifunctional ADP-heptose synthase [Bacteroidota bacterium]
MTLQTVFESFNNINVLIIGDVMVDVYEWGKVERISPEAPVPVIQINKRELRLGGASNVALNIQAMGANPILCSVIGNDLDGKDFLSLLGQKNMTKEGILISDSRKTTSKKRVLAGSQHLLRIDNEIDTLLSSTDEEQLLDKILKLLPNCKVVIFEDYDKGIITQKVIMEVVKFCKSLNIPVTVDPKKRNFLNYEYVTLFKPNLKELKEGLKIDLPIISLESLTEAVDKLSQIINADKYLITLSEKGVFIKNANITLKIDAHLREISDVSGAGDTVIAVASLCLACNTSDRFIAELANLAGGLVCEHVGAVPVDKDLLLVEAKKLQLNVI